MKFGDNLKNIRKYKKISQEELAEKLGVSRQSISKWETGENYPSMTNIMCLCTIFNCKINELVHEDMIDIDSLDEEIKMSVVKFKKNEQKKMKGISKFIYVAARIGKVISKIAFVSMILLAIGAMIIIPSIKVDTDKQEVTMFKETANYEFKDNEVVYIKDNKKVDTTSGIPKNQFESASKFFNSSNAKKISLILLVSASLISMSFIFIKLTSYLEKLFVNIHDNDTPFNMDNVSYIRKIAIYTIAYLLLSDVTGGILQAITSTSPHSHLQLQNYIIALVIFAISYVFKYGYEIQLDSKGTMYGQTDEE